MGGEVDVEVDIGVRVGIDGSTRMGDVAGVMALGAMPGAAGIAARTDDAVTAISAALMVAVDAVEAVEAVEAVDAVDAVEAVDAVDAVNVVNAFAAGDALALVARAPAAAMVDPPRPTEPPLPAGRIRAPFANDGSARGAPRTVNGGGRMASSRARSSSDSFQRGCAASPRRRGIASSLRLPTL